MEVIVDIGERSNQRVLEKFPSFGWRTTDFFSNSQWSWLLPQSLRPSPSLRQVSMFASANAVLAISGACLANSLYMRENALVPGGEFWRSFFKVPPPKRMMARHGFNLVYIYIHICQSSCNQVLSIFHLLGWSKAKLQINMNIPGKINTSWAQQPWSRVREGTREHTRSNVAYSKHLKSHISVDCPDANGRRIRYQNGTSSFNCGSWCIFLGYGECWVCWLQLIPRKPKP